MNLFSTDFLVASSSLAMGVGSVLDIGGQMPEYNTSPNLDELAILSDWTAVGNDIRAAQEEYGEYGFYQD